MFSGEKKDEQRPSEALELVLSIVRAHGGERAVFQLLDDVRARHRAAGGVGLFSADDLANAFAERLTLDCNSNDDSNSAANKRSIGTAQDDDDDSMDDAVAPQHLSVLEQRSGGINILRDAYHDGSSQLCPRCSSLISRKRMRMHLDMWCDALED